GTICTSRESQSSSPASRYSVARCVASPICRLRSNTQAGTFSYLDFSPTSSSTCVTEGTCTLPTMYACNKGSKLNPGDALGASPVSPKPRLFRFAVNMRERIGGTGAGVGNVNSSPVGLHRAPDFVSLNILVCRWPYQPPLPYPLVSVAVAGPVRSVVQADLLGEPDALCSFSGTPRSLAVHSSFVLPH